MNLLPHRPNPDPFATLVSLTAAALTGPVRPRPDPNTRTGPVAPRAGSLLERLDRWLWKQRQRDLERALTSSVDAAEVEARLRARERNLFRRYY